MNEELKVPLNIFVNKYLETQDNTPDDLVAILRAQKEVMGCTGWMLLECQMFGSTRFGQRVILGYGPNNTYKEVPNHPISPRGLASDMSTVIALLDAEEVK